MWSSVILFSFLIVHSVFALSEEEYNAALQGAFDRVQRESGGSITNRTNLSTWDVQPVGSAFSCDVASEKPPLATSIHRLTPYDISVVGAMGDSITAAMGANALTIIDDLIQFRELSWSIGGDKDLGSVTTIPNIIRKYNPDVRGFSTKTGFLTRKNYNNVAVVGAIAQDMPGQAEILVKQIKDDSTDEQLKNEWKLITLWIGGNNLCSYCNRPDKHSTANYIGSIEQALDILYDGLPRTFVNLVQIIDVTRLEPLKDLTCRIVHGAVCQCIGSEETSKASTDYQEAVNDLIEKKRQYNTGDDFAVVVQPFFLGVELPYKDGKPDKSYFAPDCFHFSTKGHKEAATALWNNMIQPVGNKTVGWQLGGDIKCPTERSPYFFTELNSPGMTH